MSWDPVRVGSTCPRYRTGPVWCSVYINGAAPDYGAFRAGSSQQARHVTPPINSILVYARLTVVRIIQAFLSPLNCPSCVKEALSGCADPNFLLHMKSMGSGGGGRVKQVLSLLRRIRAPHRLFLDAAGTGCVRRAESGGEPAGISRMCLENVTAVQENPR